MQRTRSCDPTAPRHVMHPPGKLLQPLHIIVGGGSSRENGYRKRKSRDVICSCMLFRQNSGLLAWFSRTTTAPRTGIDAPEIMPTMPQATRPCLPRCACHDIALTHGAVTVFTSSNRFAASHAAALDWLRSCGLSGEATANRDNMTSHRSASLRSVIFTATISACIPSASATAGDAACRSDRRCGVQQ